MTIRDYPECSPVELKSEHKDVRVAEVIITTNATRGNGTEENPIRRILQVWSMGGELIAERDYLDGR